MNYFKLLNRLFPLLFLTLLLSCSDDKITEQVDHFEAVGMIIYDGNEKILDYFGPDYTLEDEFASDTIFISTSKSNLLTSKFYNEDKVELAPPDEEHQTLDADIGDESIVEIEWNEGDEGGFNFFLQILPFQLIRGKQFFCFGKFFRGILINLYPNLFQASFKST